MTVLVVLREAEESVGRRDDVLNGELARASRSGMVLMRIAGFGIISEATFSLSQRRAGLDAGLQDDASFDLCTRGRPGRLLYGLEGWNCELALRHMSPASTRRGQYVDDLSFRRHITPERSLE